MLEVKNISTGYNKKQVLFDVSFTVGNNEVVVLTGGNGSGKSTVLKCIYGLLPKWNKNAAIIFDGEDLTSLSTSEMIKKGIVYIPQKNNYFESLTIQENLIICGSTGYYTNEQICQRIDEVYQLPSLKNFRNRTPFNLSAGERQLLALGNALMHKPRLLLFDEPYSGLDELNAQIISNELLKLKQQNISMLIVEHKETQIQFVDKKLKMYLGKII
jgi:branched-chain amino acid transport system ATP-binding protein